MKPATKAKFMRENGMLSRLGKVAAKEAEYFYTAVAKKQLMSPAFQERLRAAEARTGRRLSQKEVSDEAKAHLQATGTPMPQQGKSISESFVEFAREHAKAPDRAAKARELAKAIPELGDEKTIRAALERVREAEISDDLLDRLASKEKPVSAQGRRPPTMESVMAERVERRNEHPNEAETKTEAPEKAKSIRGLLEKAMAERKGDGPRESHAHNSLRLDLELAARKHRGESTEGLTTTSEVRAQLEEEERQASEPDTSIRGRLKEAFAKHNENNGGSDGDE